MNSSTESAGDIVVPVEIVVPAGDVHAPPAQPAPPPPMSAHEVASSIRLWTIEKNLCQSLPTTVEQTVLANVPAAIFSDAHETFLRARHVTSIAFSNEDKKVFVYTRRKVTKTEAKHLPNYINGCEIEYPQGHVEELRESPADAQTATYVVVQSASKARYACGSSVSPGNTASAGTIGALVKDATGTLFGISNNHVTGSCSHSPPNLPILAPGVVDVAAGGLHPFTIGTHHTALPMGVGVQGNVNIFLNQDAAIFQIVEPESVSSMQRDVYDTPAVVEAPVVGMDVEKVGRTTGHTKGKIVGIELMPLLVSIAAENYGFKGQVYFPNAMIVHGETDLFSDNGDSGSLVVHRKIDGTLSAVGLIFAGGPDSGAPGNKKTYMAPLQPILDALGVTLVHGFNV